MKRIISVIILLVLLLTNITSALAVDLDLSSYTDEEIEEILNIVNQEMISRKMVKTANVPAGNYIAGVDIPAGKYYVEVANKDSLLGLFVHVYSDSSKSDRLQYFELKPFYDETCVVNLQEGNMLYISKDAIIKTFYGIIFE